MTHLESGGGVLCFSDSSVWTACRHLWRRAAATERARAGSRSKRGRKCSDISASKSAEKPAFTLLEVKRRQERVLSCFIELIQMRHYTESLFCIVLGRGAMDVCVFPSTYLTEKGLE